MRSPSLSRETVLILSNIGRETVRKPLARSGYFQAEELRLGLIARKGTDTNRGSHIEPVVL